MRLRILTEPPVSQNTAAFLSPLVWNQALIRRAGIDLHIHYEPSEALFAADIVGINSKFWSGEWRHRRDEALRLLDALAARGIPVVFFDRTSSVGGLVPDVLPYVRKYLKGALYSDRGNYCRPVYGGRLFSDYYRRDQGVRDSPEFWSTPIAAADLSKLGISWNTGLANYGIAGPRMARLFGRFPLRLLLSPARRFADPAAARPIALSCRMGTSYRYATVAYQRVELAKRLGRYMQASRISKWAYTRELRRSRIVASPFGYSEINYKDFEVFLAGAALLKPDMSHIETWPDFFRPAVTYAPHRWDLTDLQEKVESLLGDQEMALSLAQEGQRLYRWHTVSREGRQAFADRFSTTILQAAEAS